MKSAYRLRWCSVGVIMISLTWSLVSPIFAATGKISVQTELLLHWFAFGSVFAGVGVFCSDYIKRTAKPRRVAVDLSVFFAAIVITCSAVILWLHSEQRFFSWKLRQTTNAAWQETANEMNVFATQVSTASNADFWIPIQKEMLSPSFDSVGLNSEFAFGRAQLEPSSKIQTEVVIAYGYKSRRWGLWRTDDIEAIKGRWPRARIASVAENLSFFVTADF